MKSVFGSLVGVYYLLDLTYLANSDFFFLAGKSVYYLLDLTYLANKVPYNVIKALVYYLLDLTYLANLTLASTL